MQVSPSNVPLKPSLIFPFSSSQPVSQSRQSLQSPADCRRRLVSLPPLNSLRGSGFLSAIGRTIEEEEYRKARAEVARRGLDVEGYSIEGISVGGHETCLIVPEFKCAFDIGKCPSRAIQQNFVFITHAHLDHIVSSRIPSPCVTIEPIPVKVKSNVPVLFFGSESAVLSPFSAYDC